MAIAKVQHYVPQFLLRNFGNGKKDQLWGFYDKTSDRSFPTNAKNVASESRFSMTCVRRTTDFARTLAVRS